MIEEFAPAKINLALHVTGQRHDGYHLLDSLVCFADVGDRIVVESADTVSLHISGANGELSNGPENSVLRAAKMLSPEGGAAITLEKNLPIAAGIGGGSSDAAATLRALSKLWAMPVPSNTAMLGADVPACVAAEPVRMSGIGDELRPLAMPTFQAVLVNPRLPVSTPDVFEALVEKSNDALQAPPSAQGIAEWIGYLAKQRNDLQRAAISIEPSIKDVLSAIAQQQDCLLTRMSGSGATCFGLFKERAEAGAAADALRAQHPNWWIVATTLRGSDHA